MTPEQQGFHQFIMSPQIENVELAFAMLNGGAIEIDLKPYKDLIYAFSILECNFRLEKFQDMLWNATYFSFCTTALRRGVGVAIPSCKNVSGVSGIPGIFQTDYSLFSEISSDEVVVSNQMTLHIAQQLKSIDHLFYMKDLFEAYPSSGSTRSLASHLNDFFSIKSKTKYVKSLKPESDWQFPYRRPTFDVKELMYLEAALHQLSFIEDVRIQVDGYLFQLFDALLKKSMNSNRIFELQSLHGVGYPGPHVKDGNECYIKFHKNI